MRGCVGRVGAFVHSFPAPLVCGTRLERGGPRVLPQCPQPCTQPCTQPCPRRRVRSAGSGRAAGEQRASSSSSWGTHPEHIKVVRGWDSVRGRRGGAGRRRGLCRHSWGQHADARSAGVCARGHGVHVRRACFWYEQSCARGLWVGVGVCGGVGAGHGCMPCPLAAARCCLPSTGDLVSTRGAASAGCRCAFARARDDRRVYLAIETRKFNRLAIGGRNNSWNFSVSSRFAILGAGGPTRPGTDEQTSAG